MNGVVVNHKRLVESSLKCAGFIGLRFGRPRVRSVVVV